ncbi:DUF3813 domain-containing protein [Metabacillus sediminilitoris]|uniref:DUF3813 domain-containing protein n=1 Tax=Metabacillus sediminilitoris TaxID=2567941 RepID=A0A4V3WF63_9BACI|nr:DUF3813 domain-containing protein [Metabacillus sediminilitoris]QGQ44638.1 DUF3813 family protein [Metabacillus sediminilitoris]THF79013.1 DUF3813 domain-containing protein [Metabacillus sediminilitoris]
MGNQLFQQARESVAYAHSVATGNVQGDKYEAIIKAKNALSSAFVNSTEAEREQLREFQQVIESI